VNDHAFQLHERLASDCRVIADLTLCRVLLMNDRRFPWLILVPRRAGLRELHDVPAEHRVALMAEIEVASKVLLEQLGATKINVGALGNVVPQLHVHVVGRRAQDAAWPAPVWGFGAAERYEDSELDQLSEQLRLALGVRG